MKQGNIGKGLSITVIILFLGLAIQSSVANDVSINSKFDVKNEMKDKGLGFISCFVFYIYFLERETRFAWNVEFELIDYDTGKIIEEKTKLFGYNLFKFVPIGNNYTINIITPKGNESVSFSNLGLFHYAPIGVLITEY